MIATEAWVLHMGLPDSNAPGELSLEEYQFAEPIGDEVLAEPLFGCWEGNMAHALSRKPVDICRLRCEKRVVLGNAGVVRVLQVMQPDETVSEGRFYVVAPLGKLDSQGYPTRIFGYDHPGTVGLLAKQTKLRRDQLVPIPADTRFDLRQWAASSVRMACAWDNWKVAWACWRSQMDGDSAPPHVWAWGGGVALAELLLAKQEGCRVAMIASSDRRLRLIEDLGVRPIDRRLFSELRYDDCRFAADAGYRECYLRAERVFLEIVREATDGERISIFIDNIGAPVIRATLKAMARQGVVTTLGWEAGTEIRFNRAVECINRHIHVHTHGARYAESLTAAKYAERTGWIPPLPDEVWTWDRIPELARRFEKGEVESYFPVFQVNTE